MDVRLHLSVNMWTQTLSLSSYLGCLALLIWLPFFRSLPRRVVFLALLRAYYMWLSFAYLTFVCPLFLGFLFWIPSWRRCGCFWFVSSACAFGCVCVSSLLFSERFPGLIRFGSDYLVTTAGFVADQFTFWHFPPITGGCSEGLGAFWFFFKHSPGVKEGSTFLLRRLPWFFIVRRIQPSLSLVDHAVEFCVPTTDMIVLHLLGMMWGKIPVRVTAPGFELTSQRQKVSRLPTEPPGRPGSTPDPLSFKY